MRRAEMEQLLKENGFVLIRSRKHSVWRKGDKTIVMPSGSKINDGLAKDIEVQIKREAYSKTHRLA